MGYVEILGIKDWDNALCPYCFEQYMNECGVIYYWSHGEHFWIDGGPIFGFEDPKCSWMMEINEVGDFDDPSTEAEWSLTYFPTGSNYYYIVDTYTPHILYGPAFLKKINLNKKIIYFDTCHSSDPPISEAFLASTTYTDYAFLGFTQAVFAPRADMVSYFFFYYMIHGYDKRPLLDEPRIVDLLNPDKDVEYYYHNYVTEQVPDNEQTPPMSVQHAFAKLKDLNMTIDKNTYTGSVMAATVLAHNQLLKYTPGSNEIYFPARVEITVTEE